MSDPVSDFNAKQSEFYETHDRTIPALPDEDEAVSEEWVAGKFSNQRSFPGMNGIPALPDEDTQPMAPPDEWPLSPATIAMIADREWQTFRAERIAAGRPEVEIDKLRPIFVNAIHAAWKVTE